MWGLRVVIHLISVYIPVFRLIIYLIIVYNYFRLVTLQTLKPRYFCIVENLQW